MLVPRLWSTGRWVDAVVSMYPCAADATGPLRTSTACGCARTEAMSLARIPAHTMRHVGRSRGHLRIDANLLAGSTRRMFSPHNRRTRQQPTPQPEP
jgi:hypothetical protein